MSLETLLEAARYLDKVEQNSPSFIITSDPNMPASNTSGSTIESPVVGGGHLLIDPNLPISCQFHTYSSSSAPGKALSFTLNNSTKKITLSSHNGNGSGGNSSSNSSSSNGMMIITPGIPIGLSNLSVSPSQASLSSSLSSNHSGTSYRGRAMSSSSNSSGKGYRGGSRGHHNDSDKDSLASSRHRESHKTSEKNRRAHLRDCFEQLKKELPQPEYRDRKSSHINIIHCALRYIQCLKRIEGEHENEIARLTRTKQRHQNTITQLRQDLDPNRVDVDEILKEVADKVLGTSGNASYNGPNSVNINTPTTSSSLMRIDCDQYQSDGEVIVELEADNSYYDDETTTTASECADEARGDNSASNSGSSSSTKSPSSLLNRCLA
ncbi:uncharacterized protein LOC141852269 [Brevipalpus obovatus]|uniref:uncharacterized protein LOC141852269 n=1 Tax=Brevipalpus obovatus TaxID=246614 RepID=UPI003D9EC4D0